MNCPHCGGHVETPQDKTRRERQEAGLCIECERPSAPYLRCQAHRIAAADRRRGIERRENAPDRRSVSTPKSA